MSHLLTLNKYFAKYKWFLILGIAFIILTNYFRILAPQLTGYVIDTVTQKFKPGTTATGSGNYDILVQAFISWYKTHPSMEVLLPGLTLLGLAVLSGFFMFLMRQTIIVMSRHIEFDQKNEIFAHYQKLNMTFYKTHSTGDLMNRISEDVSRVRMYTGPAVMYFINLATILGFSIFFMLKTDPRLTMYTLAPLPILAVTIYFVNNIINKKSEQVQQELSNLSTHAQESYSGIRVIKSFVQEKAMLGFFKNISGAYKKQALGLAKTEAVYFPSMGLLIGLSTLLTIFIAGWDVIHTPGANVGKIAEFVMYIQMLTFPVSAIGWTASMTQRAATSQKRINEFLLNESVTQTNESDLKPELAGNIHLQNVSFTYSHTGIQALSDFTLKINKGEKIAIIGKTGSGKSTLAQLLLRVYEAAEGMILYEGIPVNKINLHHLRNQVAYVPQDVFLFSDTVENNISFGEATTSHQKVIQAALQASVHEEILQFPQQYQTLIGERGVTLSGGQKQRISIARALIKNPEIVIFDDCLSAVDARTEKKIIGSLYDYLANKTAIIITHRIFTLFDFDKIIVLENGRIKEQGTHISLMEKKGEYHKMYMLQQKKEAN